MAMNKDASRKDAVASTSEQRVGELVRELRSRQEVSLRTLAGRAGFSPSFVSQVERGQASPSIASLERLAHALGVTLGEFFRPSATARVTRFGERAELTSAWSQAHIEALGPTGPGRVFEPMMITLAPGGESGGRPYSHSGDEFALVFEGEVRLTLGEETYQLTRGDAATFAAEIPHRWENVGADPARVVVVSAR
jgi:transcriptional regulator with XRE-family HTH domain